MHPYQQHVESVLDNLKSTHTGLTSAEARLRLEHFGSNELVEGKKKSPLSMFLGQFTDFLIIVLIAAAVVSGIIGELSDTIAIVVIVVLNATLGFSQEYRAEKALQALKKMAAVSALVIRDNVWLTTPASELVPGDIVALDTGKIVPADLRIIECVQLSVDESSLTGESHAVQKQVNALDDELLPLGDRLNMLYKGTFVTFGRGRGVVTATGMNTELGRIASMLETEEEARTPLQKRLADFGKKLAFAILVICAVIFTAGLMRGEKAIEMFLVAVSLAVAAIPEALPAVVTISLALGARKLVKRNALIRKLPAVETLGSVTCICTDKTGTLTENRMTVEKFWVDGKIVQSEGSYADLHATRGSTLNTFFIALALSNDALLDDKGDFIGDPTESALLSAAHNHRFEKKNLELLYPRVAEIPFDSSRKLMTTIHEISGIEFEKIAENARFVSFTKGALESLLPATSFVFTAEGLKPPVQSEILNIHDRMAADGLRVIAIATRTWDKFPDAVNSRHFETDLTLLGLVGMIDPPRAEAQAAVEICKTAGITPVMITGDHPLTARVIAKRVGILTADDPAALMTGKELAALSNDEFEKLVDSVSVYARVAPDQKLKIVKALKDRGHFVAMTGDGVNDAPALRASNIGVSMGITGTDVAKEASSMILLDDNFATIVNAVREGRMIYDNIRKFIKYLLTTNSGEIWTLFLAPFFGLPIPLIPIQILWINLMTDGLPALALSLEPAEGNIMMRPPRHPRESIFAHGLGIHAIWVGLLMAAVVLSLQYWAIHVSDAHWQTMVFTVLCFLQLGHVLAIRSETKSLFSQGILSNRLLIISVLLSVGLQLATIYVPFLNPIFTTEPLSLLELVIVLLLSSAVFIAVEIEKAFKRR
jgi:Ca2+-transporting ATPase